MAFYPDPIGVRNFLTTSFFAFHIKLVQEKRDPVYYGETVLPGDVDLVLLRWRLDSGEYKVIYGDLHEETVSAERLAELESTIVN